MAHWYTKDLECKDITLVHARGMDVVPSVTTIEGLFANEGLTIWKLQTPDWKEQSEDAANFGTEVHAAISNYLQEKEKKVSDKAKPLVDAAKTFIHENKLDGEAEKKFVTKKYGGSIDFVGNSDWGPILLDWKTQKTKENKAPRYYDSWKRQLAAYSAGIKGDYKVLNVVLSTTEPGRIDYKFYDSRQVNNALNEFKAMLFLFYQIKKLRVKENEKDFTTIFNKLTKWSGMK